MANNKSNDNSGTSILSVLGEVGWRRILKVLFETIGVVVMPWTKPKGYDLEMFATVAFLRSEDRPRAEMTVEEQQKIGGKVMQRVPDELYINVPINLPVDQVNSTINEIGNIVTKYNEANGKLSAKIPLPVSGVLSAEWQYYAADPKKASTLNDIEKYELIEKSAKSDNVVLYIHGGSHYVMDPATHRSITTEIAKTTGARIFSLRYRLAPQSKFPNQILDCLLAYQYLLNPPAGSLHKPVKASNIFFCGDSAGGGLVMSTLLALLEYNDLPNPAGAIGFAPFVDNTHSFDSFNTVSDKTDSIYNFTRGRSMATAKKSEAWDGDKTRVSFLAPNNQLLHPLISAITVSQWKDSPPIMITVGGGERLRDEGLYLAKVINESGSKVIVQVYENMCHVFQLFLRKKKLPSISYDQVGEFIQRVSQGKFESSSAEFIDTDGVKHKVPFDDYRVTVPYNRDQVLVRMRKRIQAREQSLL